MKHLSARKTIDLIKAKLDIDTDKELAATMGVKYGTLTQWVWRNSIPKDPLVEFAQKRGFDLNEILNTFSNIPTNKPLHALEDAIKHEADRIASLVKEAYLTMAENSTISELKAMETKIMNILKGSVNDI